MNRSEFKALVKVWVWAASRGVPLGVQCATTHVLRHLYSEGLPHPACKCINDECIFSSGQSHLDFCTISIIHMRTYMRDVSRRASPRRIPLLMLLVWAFHWGTRGVLQHSVFAVPVFGELYGKPARSHQLCFSTRMNVASTPSLQVSVLVPLASSQISCIMEMIPHQGDAPPFPFAWPGTVRSFGGRIWRVGGGKGTSSPSL